MFDTARAVEQFRDAIQSAGLPPPHIVIPGGKLHRFATNGKPKDDSGWYVFHEDGIPAGAFGDWRTGASETWHANIGRELTPQEAAAHRARVEGMQRERDAEDARIKGEARTKAAAIWNGAAVAPGDHPYLVQKRVGAHGLRVHEGRLIVPMRDDQDVLHSLQFIDADGGKLFLKGGRVKGCYLLAGAPDGMLCIAEGFATAAAAHEVTGYAVAVAFSDGNLLPVARTLRAKFPDLRLIVCADDDASTPGNPGLSKAREAAQAVGALLAVPDFGGNRPEGATDFDDMRRVCGDDGVRECILKALGEGGSREPPPSWDAADAIAEGQDIAALRKAAHGLAKPFEAGPQEPKGEDELNTTIGRLAAMSAAAYEKIRAGEAKRLGVRVTVLDKLVAAEKKEDCTVGQGKQLELPEPEPWPEPVDGAALIAELEAAINRYVVLPKDAAFTCALWVLHAHCFDTFTCTPRLAITAPEKRCGKTTLLDVIGELVSRPLPTANITAAAIFRTIEVKRPVMLIDEADTFIHGSEDLRGILNSGHRAGGQVVRTVGEEFEPRAFSTHCPVAIAQIGKLPSTLADFSISIEMRRRTSSEKVVRFRNGRTQELGQLARMAARWVADNDGAIRECDPAIPEAIFNRAADNWEALLSIAEVAGAKIAEHARQVALAACGGEDEQSLGVMLLTDIREVFGTKKEIASVAPVAALVAMCDHPWGECNRGKALTQNWLARRLKPFGVHPKNVGPKRDQAKGYTLESFADAFKRYIPPDSTVHPYTANKNIGLDENQTVHQTNGWTDANADNQLNLNEVYGSTVENPLNGDSRECADDLPPGDHDWEDSL
jgi:putative DNA primase/helicase